MKPFRIEVEKWEVDCNTLQCASNLHTKSISRHQHWAIRDTNNEYGSIYPISWNRWNLYVLCTWYLQTAAPTCANTHTVAAFLPDFTASERNDSANIEAEGVALDPRRQRNEIELILVYVELNMMSDAGRLFITYI